MRLGEEKKGLGDREKYVAKGTRIRKSSNDNRLETLSQRNSHTTKPALLEAGYSFSQPFATLKKQKNYLLNFRSRSVEWAKPELRATNNS